MLRRLGTSAVFLIAVLAGTSSWAADYYISPTGNDTTGDGSTGTPWKTLDKVWSSIDAAGDTVILKDGNYNYAGMEFDNNIDVGTSWASSVTIKAENLYGARVTLNNALSLTGSTTRYLLVDGIDFDGPYQKAINGHQWKFTRPIFAGGETSGNVSMVAVGNNDSANSTTAGLIEDATYIGYSTGSARYMLLIFNSARIIARRGVSWLGDGWDDGGSQNPSANVNFYNSRDCIVQNYIVLDSTNTPDTYNGPFLFTNNSGISNGLDSYNNQLLDSIAIRNAEWGLSFDGSQDFSSETVRNVALIDNLAGGVSFSGKSMDVPMLLDKVTVHRASFTALSGTGMGWWGSGAAPTIKNSIISNWSTDGFDGLDSEVTYDDCYNNGGACPGNTGETTVNPKTNGLTYFTRIETGSALKTAGSSGGQIGAEIVYKLGTSGTLWGETGYNTLTADPLWPYPNQAPIKTRMCGAYSHGWCATSYSLQQYVNGYGNSPYSDDVDVTSPTAPGTPAVTSTGTTTLDLSWSASTDAVGVTSYEIDVSTDGFSTFSAGYNDFDMGSGTTEQLTGLTIGTAYAFRIRAKDAAGNTSSNSSAGFGTTSTPTSAVSSPKTLSKLDFGVYVVNFGLYASSATWITEIALAKEMGAGIIRSNWDMEDKIWISSLTWDFGYITWIAQYAAANGIKLYMTLPWRATWQTGHSSCQGTNPYAGTGTPSTTQCPDASITNQGIFASSMATALDRYIDTYELYNEFDLLSASTVTAHKAGIAAAQAKAILDVNPAARIAIVCTASPKLTLYNGNTTSGATQFPGHHELSAFYSAFSSSLTYIGHGVTMSSFTTSAHPYFRAVGDNQTFQLCMTTISAMSGNFGNDTPTIDFTEGFAFGGSASGSYPAWEIDKSSAFARAFAIHQSSNSAWGGNGGRIIIHNMAGYDFSATTTSYAKRPLFVMGKRLFELNGFYSHGDQGDGTNVRKYKFTQGNRTVWIVWTESGTSSWSLNPSGVVDVTDIYGIRQLHKANEFSPYTITTAPVVVEEVVAARRVTGGTLQ